jgi:hypothetical protein
MKTKMLMLILTCALLDVISFSAQATTVHLGAWSKHTNPVKEVVNEKHDLIAIEHNGYAIAHYKNSFDHKVFAVAKRVELYDNHNIEVAIYLGAMHIDGETPYTNCFYRKVHRANVSTTSVCAVYAPELVYKKYKTRVTFKVLGDAIAVGPSWEF